MNPKHSDHCHCVCTDLEAIKASVEMARAIHIKFEPREKPCLVCNQTDGTCANCRWIRDCVACGELWPCDTFKALDWESL